MTGLLELQGVLDDLESPNSDNHNLAKEIWKSIKDRFSSLQSSNCTQIFNDFLHLNFREDPINSFIAEVRVAIKKMIDVGIDLPQDILAYLVLFKFPSSLHLLKRQIMHSDKDLKVKFVFNHSTQFNNKSRAETRETGSLTDAALYTGKNERFNWTMRASTASGTNSRKDSRCTEGHHNSKQDYNHKSESCWHLHPDKAPAYTAKKTCSTACS
ncbi:hypothetical protein VP01_8743g1 [Puccinia sorghi]|uniref:Uncharacterized protein n=1 Tax=Puccinia sorghi TaxID=27349 RepID=A0A0L6U9C4_9BASI|nr:hypothetical protein VP01_8743g1 [Puccinia sorghi]